MAADRILLVYRTQEGQTLKIAERIAARLRAEGATVEVADAATAPAPTGYDAAVLGDSIHVSKHSKELTAYVRAHASELRAMRSALFQVSMASASTKQKDQAAVCELADQLVQGSGWQPGVVGLFAGSLAYTKYGWFTRQVMRFIAKRQGGSTDTSRDHEYTDWQAVDQFAAKVLTL